MSVNARQRRWLRRLVALLVIAAVATAGGYTLYVGAVGSDALAHPTPAAICATPQQQFGWRYEAINYDIADDAALARRNPDPTKCPDQGSGAGDEVVTTDGVSIAGWYIPAADGTGPSGPTIVLLHGWNANKSEVLRYGLPLHERFNLVALDLRGGGRSGRTDVTFGPRERFDVRAIVDWLEREKGPTTIGLVGNSMGGAVAAAAAADDPRIDALLLDSTHAKAVDVFARRLEVEEGHPPFPGWWAMAVGMQLRTGEDIAATDPIATIPRLGRRPVLLIHGTDDPVDRPAESAERNVAAAQAAGVPATLRYCEGGRHGNLIDHCPDEWGRWANDFFADALAADFGGVGSPPRSPTVPSDGPARRESPVVPLDVRERESAQAARLSAGGSGLLAAGGRTCKFDASGTTMTACVGRLWTSESGERWTRLDVPELAAARESS